MGVAAQKVNQNLPNLGLKLICLSGAARRRIFFSPFSGVKNGESKSPSPSLFSNASTIAVSPYQVSQVRRQRVLAQAQLGLQPEIVF